MSTAPKWPEERIALLRSYWNDGHSAVRIAKTLGISRCAVLGKVHRLGLTARVEGGLTMFERAMRALEWNNRERGNRKEYFRERRRKLAEWAGRTFTPHASPRARPPKPSEMIVDAPKPDPSVSVTFVELTHGQCRWIDGEPNGLDTLYCGAAVLGKESFCPHHYLRTRTGDVWRYTGPKNHKKAGQVIWAGNG